MKRLILAALAITFLLAACGPSAASPTPLDVPAMQTQAVQTAYAMLTLTAPAATPTPLPTATGTPVPPATSTPTPDFSVIKHESLYFNGTAEMVLVFALNGARGEFRLTGNEYAYECQPAADDPDQLLCRGAFQAPGREVIFNLYESSRSEALLTLDILIPSLYPPTPEGMWCEIEPLWMGLGGGYGCYAVTCTINGQYYDGTPDTCVQPWRWPVP
ncbi:MAG: hypothetical protein FD146_2468 [Anaerolineaceae bacterium]|nr:MAG: hypothetical protein FD146_2468 [Anaerolineaceae bacterium]